MVDLTLISNFLCIGAGKLSYFEGSDGGENGGARRGLRRSSRCEISEEALSRRCSSKGRGSLYDPIYGICCHFCRFSALICFCFRVLSSFCLLLNLWIHVNVCMYLHLNGLKLRRVEKYM